MENKDLEKLRVGIIVVADKISDEVKNRFSQSIKFSKPIPKCKVLMMCDDRKEGEPFNKCKLLNKGLRQAFKSKFDVIIQTDIDLIIPPGAIDFTCGVALEGDVCCHLPMTKMPEKEFIKYSNYDEYPWKDWRETFKTIYATGCWNGLQPKVWKITGGFNEDMTEWGFEDRDWRARGKRHGIKWRDKWCWGRKYPLIHINHPDRTINNSSANKQCVDKKRKSWL